MNDRDLMKKLREESKLFVPNIKNKVLNSIDFEPKRQRPSFNFVLKPALLFSLTIILVVVIGIILPTGVKVPPTNTLVTIDINPSIELEVDQDYKVASIRPLNVDGALLLEDSDDLIGDNSIDAIDYIIGLAVNFGYLEDDNPDQQVLINAINDDFDVETKINNVIEYHFMNNEKVRVYQITEELKQKAEKLNITPRKMILVERATNQNTDLTYEEAAKKTIKDLNEIARSYVKTEIEQFKVGYQEKVAPFVILKQQAIENYLNSQQEIINKVNEIKEMISNHESLAIIKVIADAFIIANFPEYQNDGLITYSDYQEVFTAIEQKINEKNALIIKLINDKFENQIRLFRDYVRDDLINQPGNYNFNFEFDNDFSMNEYQNNQGFNQKEKEALGLINEMNTLIDNARKNHGPRVILIKQQIEAKMEVYTTIINSTEISDQFKNSTLVTNFEQNYRDFRGNN